MTSRFYETLLKEKENAGNSLSHDLAKFVQLMQHAPVRKSVIKLCAKKCVSCTSNCGYTKMCLKGHQHCLHCGFTDKCIFQGCNQPLVPVNNKNLSTYRSILRLSGIFTACTNSPCTYCGFEDEVALHNFYCPYRRVKIAEIFGNVHQRIPAHAPISAVRGLGEVHHYNALPEIGLIQSVPHSLEIANRLPHAASTTPNNDNVANIIYNRLQTKNNETIVFRPEATKKSYHNFVCVCHKIGKPIYLLFRAIVKTDTTFTLSATSFDMNNIHSLPKRAKQIKLHILQFNTINSITKTYEIALQNTFSHVLPEEIDIDRKLLCHDKSAATPQYFCSAKIELLC